MKLSSGIIAVCFLLFQWSGLMNSPVENIFLFLKNVNLQRMEHSPLLLILVFCKRNKTVSLLLFMFSVFLVIVCILRYGVPFFRNGVPIGVPLFIKKVGKLTFVVIVGLKNSWIYCIKKPSHF